MRVRVRPSDCCSRRCFAAENRCHETRAGSAMRTHWDAAEQGWEIFIEDPRDPALVEFEFPDRALRWLAAPQVFLRDLSATESVTPPFFERLRGFVARRQVQVMCRAEGSGRRQRRVLGPGKTTLCTARSRLDRPVMDPVEEAAGVAGVCLGTPRFGVLGSAVLVCVFRCRPRVPDGLRAARRRVPGRLPSGPRARHPTMRGLAGAGRLSTRPGRRRRPTASGH